MHILRTALSIMGDDIELEGMGKFPPHFTIQGKTIRDIKQQLYQDIDVLIDAYVKDNPDITLIEEGTDILNGV